MSDKILTERQVEVLRGRPLTQWYPYEARALIDSHEALRAERDAAREETQRWVQIARAALAAAQAQESTDPVKTES